MVDEEDVFGSDFESTDEEAEAAQQASDPGEKLIRVEERKEKKVNPFRTSSIRQASYYLLQAAQSRVERAAAAAHARQKVTFNPEIYDDAAEEASSVAAKKKRRVSLGLAIDAETGEVINNAQRQSRRSHTILNTSATAQRMKKDAEDKKVVFASLRQWLRTHPRVSCYQVGPKEVEVQGACANAGRAYRTCIGHGRGQHC